jgi:hypothetical protein
MNYFKSSYTPGLVLVGYGAYKVFAGSGGCAPLHPPSDRPNGGLHPPLYHEKWDMLERQRMPVRPERENLYPPWSQRA